MGLGQVAGGEPDERGGVLGELEDGLFAEAGGAAGYEDDFVGERGDVGVGGELGGVGGEEIGEEGHFEVFIGGSWWGCLSGEDVVDVAWVG